MTQEKIIFEFSVLWKEWEGDAVAWIIERDDKTRYLRMTHHGSPYEAKQDELLERIDEYENTLNQTRKALSLLTDL